MEQAEEIRSLVSDWLSPAGQADPYPIYRQLHEYGSVIGVADNLVLVVGHADAEAVLRDSRFIVEDQSHIDAVAPHWREHASRCLFQQSMLNVNGERHLRARQLVDRAFTARRVDGMRAMIERRVIELVQHLEVSEGPVDFIDEFAYLLPVNVICDVLGIPESDRLAFRRPVSDLAMALDPGWIYADLGGADAAAQGLAAYFEELMRERRIRPQGDLLSAMLQLNNEADKPVSHGELVANAVLLLLAGFETSIGSLGNGLMILLEHDGLRTRLRENPDLAPAFLAEVLRYDSPVQLTGRRAAMDLTFAGIEMKAGKSVVVALGAANRDPRRFADPDRFLLGRLGASSLSFGSGRHFCLGARLARLEGEVVFGLLPRLLPTLRLAGAPARLERTNLRVFATLPVTCPRGATEAVARIAGRLPRRTPEGTVS